MRARGRWRRRAAVMLLLLLLLPLAAVLALRWLPPPSTAFMLQARYGGLGGSDACDSVAYRWLPWEQIPDHAKMAVIAAEDQRFAAHWGFDLESIGDALRDRDARRGASTITQQVAKNLFLWPGRSWLRKGLEAYLATLLELGWPKQRILETYLNVAQFGPCVFGVAAAAEELFGVSPQRMSSRQSALLAAVLPNPVRMQAHRPSDYVHGRARWVQEQAQQLGGARYLDDL